MILIGGIPPCGGSYGGEGCFAMQKVKNEHSVSFGFTEFEFKWDLVLIISGEPSI